MWVRRNRQGRNGLFEQLTRFGFILCAHAQLYPADGIGLEPVHADHIVVGRDGLDSVGQQLTLRQKRLLQARTRARE